MLNGLFPFLEILLHLGFSLVSKCYVCASQDSLNHCFATCAFARQVWSYLEDRLKVQLLQQDIYQTFSYCWNHRVNGGAGLQRFVHLLPLAVCWGIWRVRNAYLFNNEQPRIAQVVIYTLDILCSISFVKPFSFSSLMQSFRGIHTHSVQWIHKVL